MLSARVNWWWFTQMQLFAQKIIMHARKFLVLVECTPSNRTGRWFECLSLSSVALRKLLAKISFSMFRTNEKKVNF